MKKENVKWTIGDLRKNINLIEYPEFQREPSVWKLSKKHMLIDSILRNFDISNLYFHNTNVGTYECIDGRQRINAIMSYLGENESSDPSEFAQLDNAFKFKMSPELSDSENADTKDFDNLPYEELTPEQQERILSYEINVLKITELEEHNDLNLMFLRLQLGQQLNAGEKLKAMRGEMRDLVFDEIGSHDYFKYLQIPKRRYSLELTAAQIAANFFSLVKTQGYQRVRFVDLQSFFFDYFEYSKQDKEIVTLLKERLDQIFDSVQEAELLLKNRAMGLTTFFFINKLIDTKNEKDIPKFLEFLKEFLDTLKTQITKGIDIEKDYRDLLKFQTYVSQAAVEKYAIRNRQNFLEDYFNYYLENSGKIKRIETDS